MFVIMKKRKTTKMSVICRAISASFRVRSLKPITCLFRKGRYGTQHQLSGTFFDYAKYCDRQNKQLGVFVVGE